MGVALTARPGMASERNPEGEPERVQYDKLKDRSRCGQNKKYK